MIARFRCWIERVVIGLGLCPFARKPYEGDRVRYVVSDAGEPELLSKYSIRDVSLLITTKDFFVFALNCPHFGLSEFAEFFITRALRKRAVILP